MPNYVMIPREIIYAKELGEKRVIIFSYLCSRRALDDTVAFSVSELCHWSHLKPNSHEGKINQKYLETMNFLSRLNYFNNHPDFENLIKNRCSPTDYYSVSINNDKFDIQDNFGLIYFDELEKILNFKEELKKSNIDLNRMSSAYILLLLSYLRVNTNRNFEYPSCCYRLYSTISEDIGLSERYIGRIVEILIKMKIIVCKEAERTKVQISKNKFCYVTAPKVFADYKRYVKTNSGNFILDANYDPHHEIEKQINLLNQSQKRIYN